MSKDTLKSHIQLREWGKSVDYKTLALENVDDLISMLMNAEVVAFDTESNQEGLTGFSASVSPGRSCYIPLGEARPKILAKLKPFFYSPKVIKVAHNIKWDMKELARYDIDVAWPWYDTMIACWIVDSRRKLNRLGLKYLGTELLGLSMVKFKDLFPEKEKNLDFTTLPEDIQNIYGAKDADVCLRLYKYIKSQILESQQEIETLEMRLIKVLMKAERKGICLDSAHCKQMQEQTEALIKNIEAAVITKAGHELNLASPKQLSKLLYDEFKLPIVKRTKTGAGPSTDEYCLKRLAKRYPIARALLEHRRLAKLNNTYYKALPEKVDSSGVIHPDFNQCGTESGRLSCSKPNMQQLPKEDKSVRLGIVARPGRVLLSIDYSQIEYRIAASVSKDSYMQDAFFNNRDFHKQTASEIFDIDISSVSDSQRQAAKTINYALLYGMSDRTMADRLGVSIPKARTYVQKYFRKRPVLADWLRKTRIQVQTQGYVESYFRRRRIIELMGDKKDPHRIKAGINTVIQGSAADILKMSMLAVDKVLENYRADMLLNVHDELVIEVDKDEDLKTMLEDIRKAMEIQIPGWVPLTCDFSIGKNWGKLIDLRTKKQAVRKDKKIIEETTGNRHLLSIVTKKTGTDKEIEFTWDEMAAMKTWPKMKIRDEIERRASLIKVPF